MSNETNITRQIMLDLSIKTKSTIFRNNVGTGWQGQIQKTDKGIHITNPRPLVAGLCVGSSDLIGWTERVITPDMVGKSIAIFTAVEVKKTFKSTISKEQLNFLQRLKQSGGISGIAINSDEAVDLINKFK